MYIQTWSVPPSGSKNEIFETFIFFGHLVEKANHRSNQIIPLSYIFSFHCDPCLALIYVGGMVWCIVCVVHGVVHGVVQAWAY